MKLFLSLVLLSLSQSGLSFADTHGKCVTDADCLAKYRVCRSGKCLWVKTEDEELFLLGVESAYEEMATIPEAKVCNLCVITLSGGSYCKDDGQPVGSRKCKSTVYE